MSDLSKTDAESDIGDSITGIEVPTDNEGILLFMFEPEYERDGKVPICKNLVLKAYASFDRNLSMVDLDDLSINATFQSALLCHASYLTSKNILYYENRRFFQS